MQRIILTLFLAIAAFSFTFAGEQENKDQSQPGSSSTAQSTQAEGSEMIGVIDQIDMNKKTIKFKADGSGRIQEVDFMDSTVFRNQNATLKVQDLKKGDRVKMAIDSTNIITHLDVQPPDTEAQQAQQKEEEE